MADFEHKDLDGDRLQVAAMNYPTTDTPGWLFRVLPRDGGKHLSAWLPASVATRLAELLGGERVNRTRITVGVGAVEQLQHVAENASIRWRIGEHRIEIEGRTAGEVASALRVALGDGSDVGVLDELAEMLDCDPDELLGELRGVIEARDKAEAERERLAGQKQGLQDAIDELRQRPTTAKLQQAERAAADADRLRAQALAGVTELRRELLAVGLNGMSTASLPEIAATIARLGKENNELREQVGRGGVDGDDMQRQLRELQQEHEALQTIDEQLQRAIERERELRTAAEQGRDSWIERHRQEATRAEALQGYLGDERRQVAVLHDSVTRSAARIAELEREATAHEQARAEGGKQNRALQARVAELNAAVAGWIERERTAVEAAQRYLGMLRTAREALSEARSEFVNTDTEEIEAADLSSEQAALLVAKIDRALAVTA